MGTRYLFGRAEFDAGIGLLMVEGRSCALRPRTAAVLEALLKHAGGLVTRGDLMRLVWPGLVVTANSVEQCVSELRRDLNGAGGGVLRTVPRRGYVLEAKVHVAERAPVAAPATRRVAVTPLRAEGDAGASRRLAEALSRDLAEEIARAPCVEVISASTVAACTREDCDVLRMGRELRVDYVVEGRVRRVRDRWQVSLTASETGGARQVWGQRIDGPTRAGAAGQRRFIAARASALLAADLTAFESRHGSAGGLRDAREMTKRAYYMWLRALPDMSAEALALAEEACALDETAAGPWAMIGYWHMSSVTTRAAIDRVAAVDLAERSARRALSLDPRHRLAYGALGSALTHQGRHEEALIALHRQIELNPTPGALHLLGRLQLLRGRPRLALESLGRALALAPSDAPRSAFLETFALAHLHLGNDRRALAAAREGASEPRPWPRAYEALAMALVANNEIPEARRAIAILLGHWPGYTVALHRAELAFPATAFLHRHERLLEALGRAGLPMD